MIFGPAISFAAVTGFPAWLLVLIVGLVCTIYTSIGGLIAVVINDSIQVSNFYTGKLGAPFLRKYFEVFKFSLKSKFKAFVMFLGLAIFIGKGTVDSGGLQHIFTVNQEMGRYLISVDPNPFQVQLIVRYK